AVLLAILLGPWPACIGISVALIIQALIFGDGGVIAIGANCFNMAVVMPWIGYLTYQLIRGKSDFLSTRAIAAAFIAGYIGLNAAALVTALEFGSQYHWFQAVDGTPLYFPYSVKVAVIAMMSEHLLFAGPVEGMVTALGTWFVARNYPALLTKKLTKRIEPDEMGVDNLV
ncbi:MAG TPA: energy-coupling factor ABC transporter permease, partial [Syntrophomonas sp.]|nr:energy-coupling factor ABC transporter permease [Syntrophomonas sp.]